MNKPAILLFYGRGVISTLIRWQSRGQYSHAALLMPDGQIVESWQGAGVRTKILSDWEGVHRFDVPSMTTDQWDEAIAYALDKVGSGYDYLGVLRFISRRPSPDNERWFCSELVFSAFRYVGVDLLNRIDPWAVSPGMLSYSPLLKRAEGKAKP